MTRLFAALALAGFSIVGSAAEKPLPVTVTNPVVPVEVSNADPIPVVVNSTETQFEWSTVSTSFSSSSASRQIVTVPAGKALIVDHVSFVIVTTDANGFIIVALSTLVSRDGVSQNALDAVECSLQGASALNRFYTCAGPTHFYVAPGGTLNANIQTVSSNGGSYLLYVSGHYIDAS